MKKNFTLKDIAESAGVSFKTVSRVINDEKGVKSSTREKVLKVIEEKDYRVNIHARMLSKSKTNQIMVVSDIQRDNYPAHKTEVISSYFIRRTIFNRR